MALEPPYRLNTLEDVMAFAGKSPTAKHRWMMRYAEEKNFIVRPPALQRLPGRIEFPIREVKSHLRWVVKDTDLSIGVPEVLDFIGGVRSAYLAHTGGAPEFYLDLASELRNRCHERAELRGKGAASGKADAGLTANSYSRKLHDNIELHKLMVRLLKRVLDTKNRETSEFLVRSITRMLAYDPKQHRLDRGLIERLEREQGNSSALLQDLHEIFVKRLTRLRMILFDLHVHQFLSRSKDRVTKSKAPSNLKKNIIDVMDRVFHSRSRRGAGEKLERLFGFYESRVDPAEMQKLRDYPENFFRKIDDFETFFRRNFHTDRISKYYDLYCRKLKVQVISEDAVTVNETLMLYPAKDLGELMKGETSHDCSAELSLAVAHLRHPRFFNIRIFRESEWIGNVYVLDYSDRGAIILDRIQIQNLTDFMPVRFFSSFMDTLSEKAKFEPSVRVLAPSAISNFPTVQESYESYRKKRPRVDFAFGPEDDIFSCSKQKKLYVLH